MACDFNGTSSLLSVTTPTVNLTGQAFSWIGWRYFDAISGTQYLFAANAANETTYALFVAVTATGQLYPQRSATVGSTTNATWVNTTTGVLVAGRWQHICVTHNGTFTGTPTNNWKMYVDGAEVADAGAPGTGSGSELSLAGRWLIGGHNTIARYFNGRAEGDRLYNRVLSAAEVLADYQGTAPASTSLLWQPNLNTNGTTDLAGLQTATAANLTFTNVYPQPGLQAWFRGDSVTGNPISAATDRSGNGADLAQATSGNRPALYSGSDFPASLIQNTDYDSTGGAEKHTCLDCATGTGPTFNSRMLTAFFVCGSVIAGADNAPHNEQTLISLGDPATGSTGIFDFSITPPGDIAIRRTKATTQTLTSTVYMTANPRVYAVRCNATNVKLFNELRSETLTALTADTATGIRLGATPGTIDNAWMGDIAEVLIYSKDMTDAQVQAEIARLQGVYGLSTPSKQLLIEGSSSATGYRSTDCRALVRPMYTLNPGLLIYNDATGSNTFTDFDGDIANLSAICGSNDLPTYVFAWLGANDLSTVSDNGATVYTDLTDWIAAVRADATLGTYLRQIIVTTILVNGTNTTRETSRLTYNTAIRGTTGVRVVDIASVAGLIPAGNTIGDLGTICAGPLYADIQHLNDSGYAAIQTTVTGAIRQSISSSANRLIPLLAAIGVLR